MILLLPRIIITKVKKSNLVDTANTLLYLEILIKFLAYANIEIAIRAINQLG